MRVFKRIYIADVMALLDVANTPYALGSRDVASRHGRSQTWASRHLGKLVSLGYVSRIGRVRCCYQKYGLRNDFNSFDVETVPSDEKNTIGNIKPFSLPISSTRVLEFLIQFFRDNPHREYVVLEFILATVRSSYATSGFSGRERFLARPYGASIPYGSRACGSVVDLPISDSFWIPFECFERVSSDLESSGVEWHLEDYVPDLWKL